MKTWTFRIKIFNLFEFTGVMESKLEYGLILLLALVLDVYFIWVWRRYRRMRRTQIGEDGSLQISKGRLMKMSMLPDFFRTRVSEIRQDKENRQKIIAVLELTLVLVWAIWVGRDYLILNSYIWPVGREFGVQILSNNFWIQVKNCGICSLWNSSINGGIPALADPFGSTLHPIVIITTLLLGVVNGVKIATVIALWIAGVSQWWISRMLEARMLIRIWSAFLAVVGGHLIGKMELGAFSLVLSTAMASLTLAAALALWKTNSNRNVIILAIVGAMLLVSGQGYMQLGVIFWFPAFLLLIFKKSVVGYDLIKKYLLAVFISVLLAGVLIVPVIHFLPYLEKFTDPLFNFAQPLEYISLNLLVHDWEFLTTNILGKLPYPYLSNLYIGWTPVLFAIFSLYLVEENDKPLLLTLISGIFLSLFVASAIPLRWLVNVLPILGGFRHPQLVAGLVVPPILGLASYSLKNTFLLKWPWVSFENPSTQTKVKLNTHWILLVPLMFSIYKVYDVNQKYLDVKNVSDVYKSIEVMQTSNNQWVAFPYGEHWWIEPAVENGLKVTNVIYPWWWSGRDLPEPYVLAQREKSPVNFSKTGKLSSVPIYRNDLNDYAFIRIDDQVTSCKSDGNGGEIRVNCTSRNDGILVVKENSWTGWKAWKDGKRVPLLRSQWLTVRAPAGQHTYTFKYLPWDVPLGLALSMVGVIACVWLWRLYPNEEEMSETESSM